MSFRDFLIDDSTSDMEPFMINTGLRHRDLADPGLRVMSDQNIGLRCSSAGLKMMEIIESRVEVRLSILGQTPCGWTDGD